MSPHRDAFVFRLGQREDLPAIVRLLADDILGAERERVETPLPARYEAAYQAIAADPNNELVVACLDGEVVGVLQLTFIPSLSYEGSWRALIEGVRVASHLRSQGVGRHLFEWAIARARERDARWLQLTTDKRRTDALRFYQRLGFSASHEGMKLFLPTRLSSAEKDSAA